MSGRRHGWVVEAAHTSLYTAHDLHTVKNKFRWLYVRSELDKYVYLEKSLIVTKAHNKSVYSD